MTAGAFTLSHVGIYVRDMERMVKFYTETLGFIITDRGEPNGVNVVFLSRNPNDHHQLPLVAGRKTDLSERMVQQISFKVETLEELKALYPRIVAAPVTDIEPIFHGIAFSLYFRDPEGNRFELFVDTEWFVEQPYIQPVDFTMPVADIYARGKSFAEAHPSFRPMKDWQADFERKLAAGQALHS